MTVQQSLARFSQVIVFLVCLLAEFFHSDVFKEYKKDKKNEIDKTKRKNR